MNISTIEQQAREALSVLAEGRLLDSATVVLIGSAARNTTHPGSDLDLVVVLPSRSGSIRFPVEVDAHVFTRTEFLQRLERSDELACWSIRYGVILSDKPGWWPTAKESSTHAAAWPDWKAKLWQAARRLINTSQLAVTGDLDAAWEECGLAASHLARALLLRNGTFPLSRLELVGQLLGAGLPQLAEVLKTLTLGSPNWRELSQFTAYSKKWIYALVESRPGNKRTALGRSPRIPRLTTQRESPPLSRAPPAALPQVGRHPDPAQSARRRFFQAEFFLNQRMAVLRRRQCRHYGSSVFRIDAKTGRCYKRTLRQARVKACGNLACEEGILCAEEIF